MRYFVLFEDHGGSLIKKIAGYHPFHGVREAVRLTTIAVADSDDGAVREKLGLSSWESEGRATGG